MSEGNLAFLFWEDEAGVLRREDIDSSEPLTIGAGSPSMLQIDRSRLGTVHAAIEQGLDGCRVRRLSRVYPMTVDGVDVQADRLENGAKLELGDVIMTVGLAGAVAPDVVRLRLTRDDDEIAVELPVVGSVTVIGRMEGDILVDDDSVSSQHLEIENFGPGRRWVRDLGSTNGSEINGEVLGGDRQPLAEGDILKMGRVGIAIAGFDERPDTVQQAVQRTVIFVTDRGLA